VVEAEQRAKAEKRDNCLRRCRNSLIVILCVLSFCFNVSILLLSIVDNEEDEYYYLYICTGVPSLLALYVSITQLLNWQDMHYMLKLFREKLNTTYEKNQELRSQRIELQERVRELRECEYRIDAVTRQSGMNLDEILNLSRENKEILKKIKVCFCGLNIIQHIF